jgi:hypothetical protein
MYSLVMKNKKDSFSNVEIARLIESSKEELALMVGRGFRDLELRLSQKIDSVDQRLILTKDELSRKQTATNLRIDDLAINRVKYEDHQKLIERVDKLERAIEKKRVK